MKNLNFDFWIDVAGEVWKNSEDEEKLKKFLLSGKEAFSGFQQLSKTVVELRDWELIFNDESGIIVQYGFLPKTVFPIFAGKLKALSMENKIFTENKEFREILEKNNTIEKFTLNRPVTRHEIPFLDSILKIISTSGSFEELEIDIFNYKIISRNLPRKIIEKLKITSLSTPVSHKTLKSIINGRKIYSKTFDVSLDEDVFEPTGINFLNLEFIEKLIIRKRDFLKEFSGWNFVAFAELFPNLQSLEIHLGKITKGVKSSLFFGLLPQVQNFQIKKTLSKLLSTTEKFPITAFFTDAIEVSFEDEWSFNDHVSLIKKLCPDFHVEAMTLGGISIANFKKSIDAPNKVLNYEFKFVNCYAEES